MALLLAQAGTELLVEWTGIIDDNVWIHTTDTLLGYVCALRMHVAKKPGYGEDDHDWQLHRAAELRERVQKLVSKKGINWSVVE